jgi:hypothetical protein
MPEAAIEPLSADPLSWSDMDMWGWVNAVEKARAVGGLPNGHPVVAVLSGSGARPIHIEFSRPGLVADQGWSWDRHYHDEQAEIVFGSDFVTIRFSVSANKVLISRSVVMLAILRLFANRNETAGVSIKCSLGDSDGDQPILCFSSRRFDQYLVPDPYFMLTRSYEKERKLIEEMWLDPAIRDQRVYWRGAPSGLGKYDDQFDSQRVKLVLQANAPNTKPAFNVRFANRNGLEDRVIAALDACTGFGPPEDQMEIVRYAANIDVDGVSSSWTGFFLKLLAGGTVIKVASDAGYRQWFYRRMRAWEHFAEASADLSDLGTVCNILRQRSDWARQIAQSGRALALSLDLASQLDEALPAVDRAIAAAIKA